MPAIECVESCLTAAPHSPPGSRWYGDRGAIPGEPMYASAALGLTAHALLVIDLVLFFVYLVVTSLELIKGMKEQHRSHVG